MTQTSNDQATATADSVPPQTQRVRIVPGVTFSQREVGGRISYVCHDGRQGRFFHFGAAEYEAAVLLDGTRALPDVLRTLRQRGVAWEASDLAAFLSSLGKHQLVEVDADGGASAPGPELHVPAPPASAGVAVPLRMAASLLSLRIPLFEADRLAERLAYRWGFLFESRGLLLWLAVVLSGAVVAQANHVALGWQLKHLLAPQSWPWLLFSLCLIKVAHEAGHAIAARRQGIRVGKAGLLFFLMAPLAFVDVTDAWRLPRRWARVQIALAGVYVELLIAGLAVWIWYFATAETVKYIAAQVALLAGPATLLVNANPLLRLDGYYVLSDWLQIPNLRMHGRNQIASRLEHLLLGRKLRPSLLDPRRARIASVHAVCSIAFQFVWMTGLILAVSAWARGLGMALACLAVFFWVLFPLGRWLTKLWTAEDWGDIRFRFASLCTAAVLGILAAGFLPSPWSRRVPVVIRYQDEQIARAATDGFVRAVHVRSGETVEAGDLLVEMDAPEQCLRRDSLRIDCETSRLKARQLNRRGEVAMAFAELERLASLKRQLTELERQVDALNVRATRSGVVSSHQVTELEGQYVRRGDVLLRIGDEDRKEVFASVAGSDIDTYSDASRRETVQPVRLRGGIRLDVVLSPLQPRISVQVPHPALASTAGGPLAVEMPKAEGDGSAESVRLVAPRSRSISRLDLRASRSVHVGQQGVLILGDTRSAWQRLGDYLRELTERP